jgi:uncharacterized membrane protein
MRYQEIDILKGIAVICMVIFHFFYFPNQYGFKEIKYDTKILKIIAKVAQFIFIGSVGINLTLSKENSSKKNETKEEYTMKNIKRIIKIFFFAIFMTLFTYIIFGDKYVKFGILHFISFTSLLLFSYVDNVKIINILTVVCIFIYYLILNKPELFRIFPSLPSFILGFYNDRYRSIDHFSIFPWIIILLVGINIGYFIKDNKPQLPDFIKNNIIPQYLSKIGTKSLEIYAIHWIVLYFIFCQIYYKMRLNI